MTFHRPGGVYISVRPMDDYGYQQPLSIRAVVRHMYFFEQEH